MFLLRISPITLFLLLFIPLVAGLILLQSPEFAPEKAVRLQALGVNLGTAFAVVFAAWIASLIYFLAPSTGSKFTWILLLGLGLLFRAWEDGWKIENLYFNGKIPNESDIEINSPLFILHLLVSVMMVVVLILIAVWLTRKEKEMGKETKPLWQTVLLFLGFPIGLFFIQKRVKAVF
jgi:TctA family transporter